MSRYFCVLLNSDFCNRDNHTLRNGRLPNYTGFVRTGTGSERNVKGLRLVVVTFLPYLLWFTVFLIL